MFEGEKPQKHQRKQNDLDFLIGKPAEKAGNKEEENKKKPNMTQGESRVILRCAFVSPCTVKPCYQFITGLKRTV